MSLEQMANDQYNRTLACGILIFTNQTNQIWYFYISIDFYYSMSRIVVLFMQKCEYLIQQSFDFKMQVFK